MSRLYKISFKLIIGFGYRFEKKDVDDLGVFRTNEIFIPFVSFEFGTFKSNEYQKK